MKKSLAILGGVGFIVSAIATTTILRSGSAIPDKSKEYPVVREEMNGQLKRCYQCVGELACPDFHCLPFHEQCQKTGLPCDNMEPQMCKDEELKPDETCKYLHASKDN